MSSAFDARFPNTKALVNITTTEAPVPSLPKAEIPDILEISASLKRATLQEHPDYNLVATDADVANLVESLENVPADSPPSLFVDLEGVNLSRHGSVSLLQIFALPQKKTHLIDIHTLKGKAFTKSSVTGTTLKDILESPSITKVFFDVRNDSDALYSHFGIKLAGVQDLQLMELATRTFSRRCVNGLARCIENDCPMTAAERRSWKTTKQKGLDLFAPERGGTYEVFNLRPLADEIIQYCIEDVRLLPRLWEKYDRKITLRWRAKIKLEAENRVRESQSSTFNGKGKHMALAPSGWS
ncbi:hypothetical protein BO82DRAFT_323902 [Aspergillus uvarum CBS 121591]|uniref:3'-5' exonuclease domain-containing protein n=1 Tax=Aspergillus uvarum CBS 121591 TaxID=1448315 RepID=A0A319BVE7_9EURO|nr:hypothetical protein BO82DRAFT_323902 [Aspergillus uvarum CBS 121591]PYH75519.1 hypothetical protein BO82DRAFT_323902 [Aspergillus uvarum CBS 121591]